MVASIWKKIDLKKKMLLFILIIRDFRLYFYDRAKNNQTNEIKFYIIDWTKKENKEFKITINCYHNCFLAIETKRVSRYLKEDTSRLLRRTKLVAGFSGLLGFPKYKVDTVTVLHEIPERLLKKSASTDDDRIDLFVLLTDLIQYYWRDNTTSALII